jgi:Tfp pilus assembly protein PilO
MNAAFDRQMVAQVVITLAVCLGGWMMIVEPKVEEIAELEAAIAEATSDPTLAAGAGIEELAERMAEMRDRAQRIERRSEVARDSSRLYSAIMDLVAEHGVIVHRMDPASDRRTTADDMMGVTTFNLNIEAGYQQLAGFIDAIERMDGFIRPTMISVTPVRSEGAARVEARIVCQAMHFKTPEALAALTEEGNADGQP